MAQTEQQYTSRSHVVLGTEQKGPCSGQVLRQLSSLLLVQHEDSTVVYFLILKNKLNLIYLQRIYLMLSQEVFQKRRE